MQTFREINGRMMSEDSQRKFYFIQGNNANKM